MAVVVDTCGWIEWLTDGLLADPFAPYLTELQEVIVPTSVQFELYKWVCREASTSRAFAVIGITEQGQVEPLSTSIALLAADQARQHQLSFADAIIYATASHRQSRLITSDHHFACLDGVEYITKTG